MAGKIKIFFTENIFWKVVSLGIAVMLWFVVMNIKNPVEPAVFKKTLSILNSEEIAKNDLVLSNENTLSSRTVEFQIRATRAAMQKLRASEKDFLVYIDLKPIDISQVKEIGVPKTVSVRYRIPDYLNASDYTIINFSPKDVEIVLDRHMSKEFDINVIKENSAAEGYVDMSPITTPEKITISGAGTDIDKIDSVEVKVDLAGASGELTETKELFVYDKYKNDIKSRVSLSAENVEVKIPVHKYAKIPIAPPKITGNVAEGCVISSVTWEPKFLEVVGNEEDIAKFEKIEMPVVNVSGFSDTTNNVEEHDLRKYLMDTSLSVKNGTPHDMKITIEIQREKTRTIDIPITSIKIQGAENSFETTAENIAITIKGISKVVDTIEAKDIGVGIDLSDLTEGTYDVQAKVTLPDGIIQIGKTPSVEVVIHEKNEENIKPSASAKPLENPQ